MTLTKYYKSFGSVSGGIAGLFAIAPFLSNFLPSELEAFVFPPLGNNENFCRIVAVGLALLLTFLVWQVQDMVFVQSKSGRRKATLICIGIILAGTIASLALGQRLIRTITIPANDENITVSVGFQRSEFAIKTFGQMGNISDEEMLRRRGPTEEEIQKLWTSSSLIISRTALFFAWLCVILPCVAIFSFAVLYTGIPQTSP